MCDTHLHEMYDDLLLDAGELGVERTQLVELLRTHRYHDECCRILAGDGPPRLKPGRMRWGTDYRRWNAIQELIGDSA